ncbi:MAG: hypothetical protein AB7K24_10880, partial [Gemmataceae bacterium]
AMTDEDPLDLERIDQEIRINELKAEAEELAGGEMTHLEADDCPPNLQEAFWNHVVEYEKAEWTSHHEQLAKRGHRFPPPTELDDAALTAKLWELINALASMSVYLHCTNHLSDRELYTALLEESLHDAIKDVPPSKAGSWHHDCIGSGSDEDNFLWLKYYAKEEDRARWAKDFPGDEIPPHEDPPYERDHHLPKWELEQIQHLTAEDFESFDADEDEADGELDDSEE